MNKKKEFKSAVLYGMMNQGGIHFDNISLKKINRIKKNMKEEQKEYVEIIINKTTSQRGVWRKYIRGILPLFWIVQNHDVKIEAAKVNKELLDDGYIFLMRFHPRTKILNDKGKEIMKVGSMKELTDEECEQLVERIKEEFDTNQYYFPDRGQFSKDCQEYKSKSDIEEDEDIEIKAYEYARQVSIDRLRSYVKQRPSFVENNPYENVEPSKIDVMIDEREAEEERDGYEMNQEQIKEQIEKMRKKIKGKKV